MHISQSLFRRFLLPAALGSLLVFTGCAATGPKDVKGGAGDDKGARTEEKPAASRTSVEYINVVGEGDRVLIGTTGSVKYTVFRLTDPSRLIVDMPGVDLEKVAPSLDVNNEFLSDINAISYGEQKEIGRIVIGLKDGVDHEVKSGENSILVSLRKGEAAQEEAPPVAQDETVKEEPIAEAEVETEAPKEAEPVKEAAKAEESVPERQASKILKIDSARDGENLVIKIVTDGSVGNFNSFELDSPSRIVLDVWGVGNSTGKGAIKIGNNYVKAVRIGTHPGKARLVFDAAKRKLPAHNIRKEANAIVITLGPGAAKAEARPVAVNANFVPKESPAPAAPVVTAQAENNGEAAPEEAAPAPETAPAPAPAEEAPAAESRAKIEKVDFKKVNGSGRLTIASSAKAAYDLKESQDGKTLVLDIHDSVIADELKRTLDARKLNTAVELVSSYQEANDVRVLVKLSEKVSYDVREENGGITIDFAAAAPSETVARNGAAEGAATGEAAPVEKKEDADFAKKQYTGKRIDLDMVDANITDIIRLLAEVSNLNIIASDEVKGTISLRLKNVPWDQAFDIILKSKDLDQIKEGNVVRVAPAAKIRQEKEAVLASRRAQEKLENLETRYIPVSYATPDELIPHVKTMLSDRGAVTSEKRTSTLIIRDIPRSLDAAEDLIKRLDKATPQVLIEARIVEASSTFARDLGIQWGMDYQTGGNVSTNTFGDSSTTGTTTPSHTSNAPTFTSRDGASNYAVNLPASGTAGTLGALGFVLGKAGANPLILDLRLTAGESEGKVKIISRPRIATLDNKEAKIEQGESVPFETTSASGTATTFIDANLSLTVTPHITPDGSVSMKIKASKNSIGTFRTASGQPSINKKESTTEVLVKDGETTVIGGIVISDKTDSEKGIPFLKDIPVLGWLFKSKSVADTQTELLIFITPTIIQGKDKIVG